MRAKFILLLHMGFATTMHNLACHTLSYMKRYDKRNTLLTIHDTHIKEHGPI